MPNQFRNSPPRQAFQNLWRPYTQEKTASPPHRVSRAKGAYLYLDSGRPVYDGISSWWVITHGHCEERIAQALAEQVARLDQVVFANFSHAHAEELSERLIQLSPPELTRVFYSDNGSTAVEVALKMALQACLQEGKAKRTQFLALQAGYHGDTVGAMSVSGMSAFNSLYAPLKFNVLHAEHPSHFLADGEEYIKDFRELLEAHHENLAGVIIEPLIQGAGGMIVWPARAVQEIARLCKEHDVFLIFDEVMTGFGRTGHLFALDQLQIIPDLVCLSKGLTAGVLPLGVTLASERIFTAFLDQQKSKMLFHGHSFTANPIACAAAVANLKIFESDQTLERIQKFEKIQRVKIENLKRDFDIKDARTCGTMAAIEVGDSLCSGGYTSEFSERVSSEALKLGLFVRPIGSVIYLLPPYCSTEADLNFAWDTVGEVLRKLR